MPTLKKTGDAARVSVATQPVDGINSLREWTREQSWWRRRKNTFWLEVDFMVVFLFARMQEARCRLDHDQRAPLLDFCMSRMAHEESATDLGGTRGLMLNATTMCISNDCPCQTHFSNLCNARNHVVTGIRTGRCHVNRSARCVPLFECLILGVGEPSGKERREEVQRLNSISSTASPQRTAGATRGTHSRSAWPRWEGSTRRKSTDMGAINTAWALLTSTCAWPFWRRQVRGPEPLLPRRAGSKQ